ncbi:MAG: hypothetical protein HQ464_05500, partial [Planctomycetes bacterium]|nr:hypothetical protein [Planctomycetota bacterium]
MTASPEEPSDSDAGSLPAPAAQTNSWRSGRSGRSLRRPPAGGVRTVPGVTTAAPTAQASWRGGIDPLQWSRSWWLMARRIILTAAAFTLVVLLVQMLLTVRRQVPIVVGCVASYHPPIAPIPLVGEDRALLESLGAPGKSFFDPASAVVLDTSAALSSATADEMLATLSSTLRRTKPGGPDGAMAIVYLTAIGTLDDQGRPCIIPPGNAENPTGIDDESFLQVDRLLASLRDALPERVGILVVLDACRPSTDWPLGVDDGSFTPAVEALMAGSTLKRMWVMVPAATGQHSYASAAQAASAAALEFVRGMRGAADKRPWGDADGRVELRELSAYLAFRVDHWAQEMLGERQTPVLIEAALNRTLDPAIAWVASRTPTSEITAGIDGYDDVWLAERWRTAERLRPTAIRDRPLLWSRYLHLLMRAESLRKAGAAYREDQVDVDTTVERIETSLGMPLISSARLLPGIRLAYSTQASGSGKDTAAIRWLAAFERFVALDQPRDEAAKPPPIAEQVEAWMIRAEAAWRWLVEKCESNASIDRAAVVRWLECVGMCPEGTTFNPGQLHILRMLVRWADPADWQRQPEAFRDFIRMVSKSRESGFTEDVRVDRIVGANDLASRGNAAMRAALDLAFVSGPGNIEKARRLSQESIDAFGQRLALSKQRIRALELLDTVRAELPYLTAWWVEESRHAARQPGDLESSSLRTKPADIVALLLAVEQLESTIDAKGTALNQEPSTAGMIDKTDELLSQCETMFGSFRSAYMDDCGDLATQAPDSPGTHGRIRRALAVPLALGDLRMRLLRRAVNLDHRNAALMARAPNQSEEPLPPVEPAAAVAGWIPWRNLLTNPILPVLAADPYGAVTLPTSAADIAKNVGRQVTAARAAARSLPAIIAGLDRQRAELEIGTRDSDAQVLELLARASRVSRRLAAVAGQRPRVGDGSTPTQRYFAAAWHTRLLRHVESTLEEFWGGVEPDEPIYCFHKARVLLESAKEIIRSNGVVFGDRDRNRLLASVDALASQWSGFATLEIAPNRLILPSASGVEPPQNTVSLAARTGVPAGLAALWLSESLYGRPLQLLQGGVDKQSAGAEARTGVRVASPPEKAYWQLDPTAARSFGMNREGVLDLTTWYRGHCMVVGLPVAAAADTRTIEWQASPQLPTRITVRGDLPQAQSVAIIFDCSGSMGQRLADGRT